MPHSNTSTLSEMMNKADLESHYEPLSGHASPSPTYACVAPFGAPAVMSPPHAATDPATIAAPAPPPACAHHHCQATATATIPISICPAHVHGSFARPRPPCCASVADHQGVIGAGPTTYANVTPLSLVGRWPALVQCPGCDAVAPTMTGFKAGKGSHWMAVLFFFTTGGVFSFVPYVAKPMKDVKHWCRRCGRHLATRRFGGGTKANM